MKTKVSYSFWLFLYALLLMSCTPGKVTTPLALPEAITERPAPIIFPSQTSIVTSGPFPSSTPTTLLAAFHTPTLTLSLEKTNTPTQTPLPTITPTFDAKLIVTATRAPAAICPEVDPALKPPDFDAFINANNFSAIDTGYLEFFNAGGAVEALPVAWQPEYHLDLTNDGIPEYVVQEVRPWKMYIFSCKDGKYEDLPVPYQTGYAEFPRIIRAADANRNGIPEIIILVSRYTQGVNGYNIFEWDGKQFTSLVHFDPRVQKKEITSDGPLEELQIVDLDGNGTRELVWIWHEPVWSTYQQGLPFRKAAQYYMWNGAQFVVYKSEFSPPEYRFQAVQDGDRAMLRGEYDKALELYQDAIFSDQLDWWSKSRKEYEQSAFPGAVQPAPIPTLKPDPDEYPNLAAYARYRIMLLHIARGWQVEAQIVYNTLKEKYPEGHVGFVYTQMANIFWSEYQTSGNISLACRNVVDFAELHPSDVFKHIGYYYEGSDDYHGDQSHDLYREDVCPIR